jgi:hypothetical protein
MGRAEVVNVKSMQLITLLTPVSPKITPPSELKICATFGDDEREVKQQAASFFKWSESGQGDFRSSSTEACRPFEGMGEL